MSDAQSEAEQLVNAVLPHAEGMLLAHGEFFPFGGAMTLDGDIAELAVGEEHRDSPVEEIVDALERKGIAIWLAGVRGPVRDAFAAAHINDRIGQDHLVERVHEAVDRATGRKLAVVGGAR